MAEIFLAREKAGSEILVVKRLLPHVAQHPELIQMFLDEVRIAATFEHPNIVDVYHCGSVGPHYFQSMELLEGLDLGKVCRHFWKQRQHVPLMLQLHALSSVSRGLAYAHDKHDSMGRPLNVVHRDISPHNIFVTFDGHVKILDFGVAKAGNALHQTRTGALVGKISYMSPEQARAEKLDGRSDVFSLGIVAWELAAGRRLLRVKELGELEVLQRLCAQAFPPPSKHVPQVPSELDAIVQKAMEKRPENRYQHAGEMAEDIEQLAKQLGYSNLKEKAERIMQEAFAEHIAETKARHDALLEAPRDCETEVTWITPPGSHPESAFMKRPTETRGKRFKVSATIAKVEPGAKAAALLRSTSGTRTGRRPQPPQAQETRRLVFAVIALLTAAILALGIFLMAS